MNNFTFNDLLPSSIKDDSKFRAASECLDGLLEQTNSRIPELLVYSRIEELDEQALDDLAWQLSIDYYEGYSLVTTIEEKRNIVKNATLMKAHKGTRFSLERIGELLNMPLEIVEWWQTDVELTLEPYEFDIFLDAGVRGAKENFYPDLIRLVNSLKNVRSHLRRIKAIISIKQNFYMGVYGGLVDVKSVFPQLNKEIEARMSVYLACGHYSYLSGQVLPNMNKYFLITEQGDYLLTENSDFIIAEGV